MATALPRAQLCGGGARGGRRVPLFARVSGVAEAGGRGDRQGHRARMPAGRRRRAQIGRRVDIQDCLLNVVTTVLLTCRHWGRTVMVAVDLV